MKGGTAWAHNMRFCIFWVTAIGWERNPIYRPIGKIGQDLNLISVSGLLFGDWHGLQEKKHKAKPNHMDGRKGEVTNGNEGSWEDNRNGNGKRLEAVKEKWPWWLLSVMNIESLPHCAIMPDGVSAFGKVSRRWREINQRGRQTTATPNVLLRLQQQTMWAQIKTEQVEQASRQPGWLRAEERRTSEACRTARHCMLRGRSLMLPISLLRAGRRNATQE